MTRFPGLYLTFRADFLVRTGLPWNPTLVTPWPNKAAGWSVCFPGNILWAITTDLSVRPVDARYGRPVSPVSITIPWHGKIVRVWQMEPLTGKLSPAPPTFREAFPRAIPNPARRRESHLKLVPDPV